MGMVRPPSLDACACAWSCHPRCWAAAPHRPPPLPLPLPPPSSRRPPPSASHPLPRPPCLLQGSRLPAAAAAADSSQPSTMNKERVGKLRARVAADPYDAEAWEQLVGEADRARRGVERNTALAGVYEDLLGIFPTAVRGGVLRGEWERRREADKGRRGAGWGLAASRRRTVSSRPCLRCRWCHLCCPCTAGGVLAGVCGPADDVQRRGRGQVRLLAQPAHLPLGRPLARLPQLHTQGGWGQGVGTG